VGAHTLSANTPIRPVPRPGRAPHLQRRGSGPLSRAQRLIASGQFWAQALGQGSPAVREHGNENRDGVLDGAQVLDQLDALIEQRADASRQAKAAEEEQATKHSAEQAQVSTEAPSEPSMMEEEVPSDSGDAGNTGDTGYAGDEMPAVDAAVDDGEAAGQGLGGDTADSLTLEGVEAGAVAAAPDARSATKTSVAAGVREAAKTEEVRVKEEQEAARAQAEAEAREAAKTEEVRAKEEEKCTLVSAALRPLPSAADGGARRARNLSQVSTEAPSEPSMMEEDVPSDSGDAGDTGDTGDAGDEMPAVDAAVDDGEAAGQGLGGDSLTLEGVEAGAVAAAPDARSATKTSVAAGVPLPGSHTAGGVSPLWAMGAYAFAPIVREEYKPEQQSFSAIKKGYILYTWSQGLEQSKIPYWIISDSMMNDPMIGLMLAMQLPFFAALKTSFESKFYAHMAVERVMQAMGLMEPNLILRFSRVRNPVHRWNNYW